MTSSERTSACPSIGTPDVSCVKETAGRNIDTAVVRSTDSDTKPPSNSDASSALAADYLTEENVDLDEQAILTYVTCCMTFQLCDTI